MSISPRSSYSDTDMARMKVVAIEILNEQEHSGRTGPEKRFHAISEMRRRCFPGASTLFLGVVVDMVIAGMAGKLSMVAAEHGTRDINVDPTIQQRVEAEIAKQEADTETPNEEKRSKVVEAISKYLPGVIAFFVGILVDLVIDAMKGRISFKIEDAKCCIIL